MNTRKALLPLHASGTRLPVLASAILLAIQAPDLLAAQATEEEAVLPKLTVTAQKRVEQAQDVAVTLTPLTGKDLQERGITNINQLQYQTPNLEIDPTYGSDQTQFRIRGVGLRDYATNNTSTVGVYVDEVAYPFTVQTQGLLFDLDRVEILRGPQGTLYGRNSTGGAVNFITRKPTRAPEAEVKVGYGSNDYKTLEGFVSGPLTDTLRGRLSYAGKDGGAWQENRVTGQKLGDKDINAFRGQLEWDASDALRFNLIANYGRDQSDSRGARLYQGLLPRNISGQTNYASIAPDRRQHYTGWGVSPGFAAATGLSLDDKPHRDNTSKGISLTTDWALDDHLSVTSITAYNRLDRNEYIDWDGSAIAQSDEFFDTVIKVFSQELRLASEGNGPLDWVVGGYYARERLDEQFFSDFSEYRGLGNIYLTEYGQRAETISLFGQGRYALADDWTLVFGVRQEHERRTLNDYVTGYLNDRAPALDQSLRSDETSAKLGLEWRPAVGHLLYASISRGVKSGGFTTYNTNATLASSLTEPFQPEKLLAYEIGFKSDLTQALRLNGAAFFYDYRDQQYQSQVWINQDVGNVGRLINIPRSEIWGAELELQWQPLANLNISQYIGFKAGRYQDFQGLDSSATAANGYAFPVYNNFDNDNLTNFPETSYGGALRYNRVLGPLEWTGSFDYAYHDTLNSSTTGRSTNHYWLANARLAAAPLGGNWELALYARNLFDKEYDLYKGSFLSNAQMAHSGEPRNFGVEATYRFF
ncbi:TonB-dependent receptor [Stutzerimonas kirkiae]|uniref:TonB-dependent receptor n=1 Tax=Stutzerimonas kirkiae TaxID=2211392 RepID=UPI0010384F85|nr:TonB-dependent receptor [Stutzerimonas kirkiae]TBV10498.1 TonB-dependent receptor [Stutzerimonas kirkiae]